MVVIGKSDQYAMCMHTADLIFPSIDFLPQIKLLLCIGDLSVLCVCCFSLVFLKACVCLAEPERETSAQKQKFVLQVVLLVRFWPNVWEENMTKKKPNKKHKEN